MSASSTVISSGLVRALVQTSLVGAKTVKGPADDRVSARPVYTTASTKIEKFSSALATSTMVPNISVSEGAATDGDSTGSIVVSMVDESGVSTVGIDIFGIKTPSILWIIPLFARMSTSVTSDPFTVTTSPSTAKTTASPCKVANSRPSTISSAE